MIRRPPRSTRVRSSAASDVYKRQLLAIVSDNQVLPLAPAQDYKPIFDGGKGPNTGGMGSYSPVPSVSREMYDRIVETIIRPTVSELRRRGFHYRGVLYAGLM